MTGPKAAGRKCGGQRSDGGKCTRPAGWGTNHVGHGRCKLHLGATPNHSKVAHQEAALDFARFALGSEVATDPLDGLLQAVRLAAGTVAYYRLRLSSYKAEAHVPEGLRENYRVAVKDLAAHSKAAVDAGVAERMVQITERTADRLTAAFEEALAAMGPAITSTIRAKGVQAYAAALTREEAEPVPVERRLPRAA